MRENNKKLTSISYYKGIAITGVVLVHYAQLFEISNFLEKVTHFGQMGCQIFFVLSAFALCLSYQQRPINYVQFIKRRVLKLGVGYWLTITIYIVVAFISNSIIGYNITGSDTSFFDVAMNILMLNGLIPTSANNRVVRGGWFVGTIIIFYIMFIPLFKVYFIIKEKVNKYLCRILFILFPLFLVNIIYYNLGIQCNNNSFAYFYFINQLPCFSVGFVLYDIYHSKENKTISLAAIKGMLLLFASFVMFNTTLIQNACVFPVIFSLGFMYIYIFTEDMINGKCASVVVKGLCCIGNNSYSIYLVHPFVIYEIIAIAKRKISLVLNCNDVILFFLLICWAYILSYQIGKIFSKVEQRIRIKIGE